MSYISLYRKWRSQNFDELVGQEPILKTLQNAVKHNRLAHAYLFTGPRGTGKTSTARILAKALNCEKGPTPDPCGKCDNCIKIRDGHSVDVIEIDAASNRGIDEIRELRERVAYAPVEGRYKIYIIDEVHMLTTEAFNALLKTLEEPPSHTIFVLATTDPIKVPVTIASRCQRLDFKRIPLSQVKEHLRKLAQEEKFEVEEKALDIIARSGEGSMRDSISLLDQVVSFAGQKVKADDVIILLGAADEDVIFAFAEAIVSGQIAPLLELVKTTLESGASVLQITRDLIGHYRNLLLCKLGASEALELTEEYIKRLQAQAQGFSVERIKDILNAIARAELDMKWHPHGRIVLEVALLELIGEKPKPIETRQAASPSPDKFSRIKMQWKDVLAKVKERSLFGFVSLHEGEPVAVNAQGKLVISFRKGYGFHKERLEEAKNKEAVEFALAQIMGEQICVECKVGEENAAKPTVSVEAVKEMFEGELIA